ncbi:MAG TPA: Lrp/AsnC ligand binding domain-containing protein [Candidatus Nitrosotenuis sp.]|nr:Lrp/AsnC ligand binding domain-containing protein [Candidatus Nitrosotenuis sp.]
MIITKNHNERSDEESKIFILIRCIDGKVDSALNRIKQIDSVTDMHKTDGAYDIIVTLKSDSNDELKKTALQKIRTINDVKYTLTLRSSQDDGVLG